MKNYREVAPATPLARRFVRMVLGFGVGIGLGLAPFLGSIDIPGFSALLSLFPATLKSVLIPLSALLMGTIAAGIQFYAGNRIKPAKLENLAKRTLVFIGVALFCLLFAYFLLIERVHFNENVAGSFVIGFERTAVCGCDDAMSDAQCIMEISANPNSIETCWGRKQIRLSEFLLSCIYLSTTGAFAFLGGLLLLRDPQESRSRRTTIRRPPSAGRI